MHDAPIPDTLRRVNRAVVRAGTRPELERSICDVFSGSTPYEMAWIGEVDDITGNVVPDAVSGVEADRLESVELAADDSPASHAVRTREIRVEQNALERSTDQTQQGRAVEQNYRASIAVPLVYESTLFGVLTVYTDRHDAFDDRERELLSEVGETIGYALWDLDAQSRRSELYRDLFEYAPVMYAITRVEDGVPILEDCNQRVLEKLGYEKSDIVDEPLTDIYTEESERKIYDYNYGRNAGDSPPRVERELVRADGEIVETVMRVVPRVDSEGNVDRTFALYTDVTKRRQAETVLRNAKALDASMDGVAIFNPSFECVYANEAFVSLLDYATPQAVEGTAWTAFVSTDEHDRIRQEVSSSLDAKGTWRGSTVGVRASGETFPAELSITNVEGVGIICIVRDVTDRVERERELERERQRYRTLTETAPDAIFLADPATHELVEVNTQAELLTGYSRAELLGMSQLALHPPSEKYRRLFDLYVGASEEIGPTIVTEFHDGSDVEVVTSDGEFRPVEINASVVEVGEERLFLGIFRDISERKRRERRLQLLQRQYETVFENTQDALFLVDVEEDGGFRLERLNGSLEALTGLSTEDVSGKSLHEALDSETAARVEARYRECLNRRETITYEEELSLPEGTRIWQTKLSPVTVGGEVRQLVGASRDITDLRESGVTPGD